MGEHVSGGSTGTAEAAGDTAGTTPHAPEPLRSGRDLFVGRDLELAELRDGLHEALSSRGQVVLVAGEPGMGKTRLADEVTRLAQEHHAAILWGRCWEGGGAPPYWPWVEIIRDCLREDGSEAILRRIGAGAHRIAQIVPEVRELLAAEVPDEIGDAEQSRFLLFDAVTSFLVEWSRQRPSVLVLDDVHAADLSSLLLLAFVSRHLRRMRAFIYCAYREAEAAAQPRVAELLGDVAREGTTLTLGGLRESEVGRVIEALVGVAVPDAVTHTVHQVTEGNPLFVSELGRLLASRRDDLLIGVDPTAALPTPGGVRHAIQRRLDLVSGEARRVLSEAAVFGRQFDLLPLQRVTDADFTSLASGLQEAVRTGVLASSPTAEGRFTFTHGLIREVLYEAMPLTDRLELHLRIGHALEEHHRGNVERHAAELAHHFCEAAEVGASREALEYATLAGEQAMGQFAYEDAAGWYRRALRVVQLEPTADMESHCELLLALGRAESKAGHTATARATFLQARAIARAAGSATGLADAALGYGWVAIITGVVDRGVVRLLEEALAALGDEVTAKRVDVMTRLVCELIYADLPQDVQRRQVLTRDSVALARRLDDPTALIYAIEAAAWAEAGPDNIDARLAAGDEILHLAQRRGHEGFSSAATGHLLRLPALLERGEIAAAELELRAYEHVAELLREPANTWYVTVVRAAFLLLDGNFERAERLVHRALEIGEPGRAEEARLYFTVQLLTLLREQGRTEELAARLEEFEEVAGRFPTLPALRAAVGCVYLDLGREAAARAALERLTEGDLERLPRNTTWLATMALVAELCGALHDGARAEVVYRLLAPYASHSVVFDAAVGCYGAASRYLGILAVTTGDPDRAVGHFEDALQHNIRTGARPFVAHVQYEYAEALRARDGPGDRQRAAPLLEQAAETARDVGMGGLVAKLLEMSGARHEVPTARTDAARSAVFRREGDYWSIVYGHDRFQLRDAKGLTYLARLLATPGVEVHVLELVAEDSPRGAPAGGRMSARLDDEGLQLRDFGDAGAVLDPQAKAAYRRRLEELRQDIDEAESMNDPERLAKARAEHDFLAREIAAAVGLGGRDRKAASAAERARVNVTRTIKLAVERIREQSPELGEHLNVSLHTGTFCEYKPDPRAAVDWQL